MTKEDLIAMAKLAGYDLEKDQTCREVSSSEIFATFARLVEARTREECAKDAQRYQWLREQHWPDNKLGVVLRPKDNTKLGCFIPSGSLLDDTIDRFMGERT